MALRSADFESVFYGFAASRSQRVRSIDFANGGSLPAVSALLRGMPQSSKIRHRPCSSRFSVRASQFLDIRIYFRNSQGADGAEGWARIANPKESSEFCHW